ncbi:MAG: PIG-L family deacetylase [Candidatus Magasanikbacteria bacterium]
MLHKKIVWFIALLLIVCASIFVRHIDKRSAEKVVYFLPHQDDEMVLLGSVYNNVKQGKEVYTIMVADGGGSYIIDVLNGEEYCKLHKKFHKPEEEGYKTITRKEFSAARNDEYARTMKSIGVPENNILFANPGGKDGSDEPWYRDNELTQEQAKEVIQSFYDLVGKGTYVTLASEQNESDFPHSDHIVIERALKQFSAQGGSTLGGDKVANKLFFADRENSAIAIDLLEDVQKAKALALQEYSVWKPEEGKFAIGRHSILDRLKLWGESAREFVIGN